MQKNINEVEFSVKAIHELIAKALERAIKNEILKEPSAQNKRS